jgi:hypothetical protein
MTLSCHVEVPAQLLSRVQSLLEQHPGLATPAGLHGAHRLTLHPLPRGWHPAMMRRADTLHLTISASGNIYDLSEVEGTSSGGWLGSCMPAARVELFLRHWCAAAATDGQQGDLF